MNNSRYDGFSKKTFDHLVEHDEHFHNIERWRGKKADQSGSTWSEDSLTPFTAISGANTYGADHTGTEAQIDEASVLNTGDTPTITGNTEYDMREFLILETTSTTPWKLRIVYGSGTRADAVTAGQYTEMCLLALADANPNVEQGTPINITLVRLRCGIDKIWVEAWNATDNAVISFLVGIHEYKD